jgi:hypothetical protein
MLQHQVSTQENFPTGSLCEPNSLLIWPKRGCGKCVCTGQSPSCTYIWTNNGIVPNANKGPCLFQSQQSLPYIIRIVFSTRHWGKCSSSTWVEMAAGHLELIEACPTQAIWNSHGCSSAFRSWSCTLAASSCGCQAASSRVSEYSKQPVLPWGPFIGLLGWWSFTQGSYDTWKESNSYQFGSQIVPASNMLAKYKKNKH